MKVFELIAELQKHPQNMDVVLMMPSMGSKSVSEVTCKEHQDHKPWAPMPEVVVLS